VRENDCTVIFCGSAGPPERAGVKTVFIPADNEQDLTDVAPEVLEKLEVIPVREVSEVLTRLGLLEKV